MKKTLVTLMSMFVLFSFSFCGGGGGDDPVVTANTFISKLNSFDDNGSQQYSIRKNPATDQDYIVFWDANYGHDVAINIRDLQDRDYSAAEAARAYLNGSLNNISEFVDDSTPAARHALWDTGIEHYQGEVTGYLYEDTVSGSNNLVKIHAMMGQIRDAQIGELISEEYGLTQDQGIRMAQLKRQWNQISNTREMTEADVNAFSKKALGVDLNRLKEASDQGYMSTKLVEDIAKHMDNTPEHIQNLVSDLMD